MTANRRNKGSRSGTKVQRKENEHPTRDEESSSNDETAANIPSNVKDTNINNMAEDARTKWIQFVEARATEACLKGEGDEEAFTREMNEYNAKYPTNEDKLKFLRDVGVLARPARGDTSEEASERNARSKVPGTPRPPATNSQPAGGATAAQAAQSTQQPTTEEEQAAAPAPQVNNSPPPPPAAGAPPPRNYRDVAGSGIARNPNKYVRLTDAQLSIVRATTGCMDVPQELAIPVYSGIKRGKLVVAADEGQWVAYRPRDACNSKLAVYYHSGARVRSIAGQCQRTFFFKFSANCMIVIGNALSDSHQYSGSAINKVSYVNCAGGKEKVPSDKDPILKAMRLMQTKYNKIHIVVPENRRDDVYLALDTNARDAQKDGSGFVHEYFPALPKEKRDGSSVCIIKGTIKDDAAKSAILGKIVSDFGGVWAYESTLLNYDEENDKKKWFTAKFGVKGEAPATTVKANQALQAVNALFKKGHITQAFFVDYTYRCLSTIDISTFAAESSREAFRKAMANHGGGNAAGNYIKEVFPDCGMYSEKKILRRQQNDAAEAPQQSVVPADPEKRRLTLKVTPGPQGGTLLTTEFYTLPMGDEWEIIATADPGIAYVVCANQELYDVLATRNAGGGLYTFAPLEPLPPSPEA